ncbi:MAG TPA: sugar phosphate isomerase/epimerase [Oscillospiraceae bacterium]|nr:sugar phosphate isomerase/epimerase [Oscillospiraceae bacterium]
MKFYIIPNKNNIQKSLELATEYNAGFEYNDFFLPDFLDDSNAVKRVEEMYLKERLPSECTFHGAFLDVTVHSDDKRIREIADMRINQSLDIAKKMSAKSVIFHTNYISNFLLESYRRSWVERNAEYWSNKLSQYDDINIYIENMFDSDPELLAALGERMKDHPRFGICFDYAHATIFGNDIDRWVKALAPYVKHIHINDNDLISDQHKPVGDGEIDWNLFLSYYRKYFSDVPVLIEVNGTDGQRTSLQYLEKLMK